MTPADLKRIINTLPRYRFKGGNVLTGDTVWTTAGPYVLFDTDLISKGENNVIARALTKWTLRLDDYTRVRRIKPEGMLAIHRGLRLANMRRLARPSIMAAWQRNPAIGSKTRGLPFILRHRGRLVIWNGTHRTCICRLAGAMVRANVLDLDRLLKDATNGR